MTEQGSYRISKILKDFNIGFSTLLDFFSKKGIQTDGLNINSKIDGDTVSLISKEFGKEQIIKEEARKKGNELKEKIEGVRGNYPKESPRDVPEQPEDNGLLIKTNLSSSNDRTAQKPAATPEAQPAQQATVKAEEPVKEAKPLENEEAPKAESQVAPAPKVEEPKATEPKAEEPKAEEPKAQEPKAETPKEEEPKAEEPAKTEEPKAEEPKATEPVKAVPAFNATSVEQKPAPDPEAKHEERPAPVKEQPAAPHIEKPAQPQQQKPQQQQSDSTYIKTTFTPLRGVKQVGTIDLDQFNKPKTQNGGNGANGANGAQGHGKGKRERIHKPFGGKVDVNAVQNGGNNGGNRSNDNKNRFNRDKRAGFKQQPPLHVEVNEEEIQKQIKETYARLTEGKGKTKGSKRRHERREEVAELEEKRAEIREEESKILNVTEFVTVNEIATLMGKPVTDVIAACMNLGLMVSINQRLDAETLELVSDEFGYKINFVTAEMQNELKSEEDRPEDLVPRPPVITVMGHVDHGKTSLLDFIRKTNVIAGEAGGITQHIGAYNVVLSNGRRITFLDTPGHEAFTAMRARGAKITDMAIIIIAADDAVMPQTVEAISHAQAAGVPMIFAINKIDKPGADPDKIRRQLSDMNLLVEDWGGKYQCQEISAKKGLNVDLLLEKVLLEADMLDLKANPNRKAVGTVIESSLDKGRGYLATVLVQNGTLHNGDIMLSGSYSGRVKAMFNERGQKIDVADPSTPVSVLGLDGAPAAGDTFNVMDDEREARDIANKREQLYRIQSINTNPLITLDEIGRRIAIGNFKELNLIVKGDVDGSVEALSDSLIKLSTKEIQVKVILKGVGAISESDVQLAIASNAIIIGFQVRPSVDAKKVAENEHVEIRIYSIIYDAINEVKSAIEGMLEPEQKEVTSGNAVVKQVFHISKIGSVAGCMVKDGKITRGTKVHVIRDGIVVHTGELDSLKRMKDDAKEVNAGYECGLTVKGFSDIQENDVIEAYNIVEVKRKL